MRGAYFWERHVLYVIHAVSSYYTASVLLPAFNTCDALRQYFQVPLWNCISICCMLPTYLYVRVEIVLDFQYESSSRILLCRCMMLKYYQMFFTGETWKSVCKCRLELWEKSGDVTSLQFWLIKNLWNGTADSSSLMSSVYIDKYKEKFVILQSIRII